MVFFSCDGCGEVLKKNQVDGHANRCRRCDSVSCVDCLVAFYGDDYRSHTSCITEVERYEKRDPRNKKPGKVPPQEAWMNLIHSSIDEAPADLKHYIQTIATLSNVPRKEKQFRNFAANSLNLKSKGSSDKIVAEIWTYLQSIRQADPPSDSQNNEKDAKIAHENETTVAKSRDNGHQKTGTINEEKQLSKSTTPADLTAGKVKKAMKKVLKNAKNRSLSLKLLRKAVRQHLSLPPNVKGKLKVLVSENLDSHKKKSFSVTGKTVSLNTED